MRASVKIGLVLAAVVFVIAATGVVWFFHNEQVKNNARATETAQIGATATTVAQIHTTAVALRAAHPNATHTPGTTTVTAFTGPSPWLRSGDTLLSSGRIMAGGGNQPLEAGTGPYVVAKVQLSVGDYDIDWQSDIAMGTSETGASDWSCGSHLGIVLGTLDKTYLMGIGACATSNGNDRAECVIKGANYDSATVMDSYRFRLEIRGGIATFFVRDKQCTTITLGEDSVPQWFGFYYGSATITIKDVTVAEL